MEEKEERNKKGQWSNRETVKVRCVGEKGKRETIIKKIT